MMLYFETKLIHVQYWTGRVELVDNTHTITKLYETFLERVVGCFNWGLDESNSLLSRGWLGRATIHTNIHKQRLRTKFSAFWYTIQLLMVVFFFKDVYPRYFLLLLASTNVSMQRNKCNYITFPLLFLYSFSFLFTFYFNGCCPKWSLLRTKLKLFTLIYSCFGLGTSVFL